MSGRSINVQKIPTWAENNDFWKEQLNFTSINKMRKLNTNDIADKFRIKIAKGPRKDIWWQRWVEPKKWWVQIFDQKKGAEAQFAMEVAANEEAQKTWNPSVLNNWNLNYESDWWKARMWVIDSDA